MNFHFGLSLLNELSCAAKVFQLTTAIKESVVARVAKLSSIVRIHLHHIAILCVCAADMSSACSLAITGFFLCLATGSALWLLHARTDLYHNKMPFSLESAVCPKRVMTWFSFLNTILRFRRCFTCIWYIHSANLMWSLAKTCWGAPGSRRCVCGDEVI